MLSSGSRVMIQMNAFYTGVPAGTVVGACRSEYGARSDIRPAADALTFSVQAAPSHQRNWAAPVWSGYHPAGVTGTVGTAAGRSVTWSPAGSVRSFEPQPIHAATSLINLRGAKHD